MRIFSFPLPLARFSRRYPWLVLSVASALTALSFWFTLRLELRNDLIVLLPKDLPSSVTLKKVIEANDGLGYQAIIAQSPDAPKNRAFLEALRLRLNDLYGEIPKKADLAAKDQYQRFHSLLREILHVARYPDGYVEAQLKGRVENFERPWMVNYAIHAFDREFFEPRQLLFLSMSELQELEQRLRKKVREEIRKRGGFDLEEKKKDKNKAKDPRSAAEIFGFGEMEKKYKEKSEAYAERLEVKEKGSVFSALLIRPRGVSTDLDFSKIFVPRLEALVASLQAKTYHPAMEIQYSGGFAASLQEFEGIRKELFQSFAATAFALLLLLFLYFRRWRSLILIPVPLGMGLLWSMGLTWLFIGYLNALTGFIAALLLGLGIDYGIYILDRYLAERARGLEVDAAMDMAFSATGKALATAAATTAAGFFALAISRFRGFAEFGLISGAGVLLCLLAMCTVLPAMFVLLDRRRPLIGAPSWIRRDSQGRAFPLALPIVLASALVVTFAIFALRKLPFEYDFNKLSFQKSGLIEQRQRWERFEPLFPQGVSPVVYMADSLEVLRPLRDVILQSNQAYHKSHTSKVRVKDTFSASTLVPDDQIAKIKQIQKIRAYLEGQQVEDWLETPQQEKDYKRFLSMLQPRPYGVSDLPLNTQRDLLLYNKDSFDAIEGYLLVVENTMQTSNGWQALQLDQILKSFTIGKATYHPTGEGIIVAKITHFVHSDSILAIIASLIAVALLVFLDLQSFRLTLLSLWPLATGLFALVLIQVFFNFPMNLFNVVVVPSLLGIGVDAGVHMLHRYREESSYGTMDVQRDLLGPVLLASFTTVISFASMIFANHLGLRSMGWIAVIGLITILLGSLLALPALMEVIFRKHPLQRTPASSG